MNTECPKYLNIFSWFPFNKYMEFKPFGICNAIFHRWLDKIIFSIFRKDRDNLPTLRARYYYHIIAIKSALFSEAWSTGLNWANQVFFSCPKNWKPLSFVRFLSPSPWSFLMCCLFLPSLGLATGVSSFFSFSPSCSLPSFSISDRFYFVHMTLVPNFQSCISEKCSTSLYFQNKYSGSQPP